MDYIVDKCRLAIVDDHPIFLEGLINIFSESDEFIIMNRGACAGDAVRISKENGSDVILMDLDMPGSVLSAIREIRMDSPDVKILMFTASMAVEHAVQVLEAGAHGYVVKGSTKSELTNAIRAVLRDETYVTQAFAAKVISALQNAALRKRALQSIKLNVREHQIIRLLLRGKTNREIGERLNISEKTVKHYMSILIQKLQVRNRTEVVLAAQKLQIEALDKEPAVSAYLQ
ncbi:response regulator [Paracoccus zhejiangensis]|uniref:DNA-binding response regulator n=1 Tax=Paracoccus zhejiangensis TaxID=1077935 RepID=A0A2H5F555_9RHOB|nr:response regulator transcription factor [Paracoccus zhejiangensis]AUH66667.1 DNA-binding response regulator [Paracoccus zhejiangensis]